MNEIRWPPSATGEPVGNGTGQRVTRYIVSGTPYANAWAKLDTPLIYGAYCEEREREIRRMPGDQPA